MSVVCPVGVQVHSYLFVDVNLGAQVHWYLFVDVSLGAQVHWYLFVDVNLGAFMAPRASVPRQCQVAMFLFFGTLTSSCFIRISGAFCGSALVCSCLRHYVCSCALHTALLADLPRVPCIQRCLPTYLPTSAAACSFDALSASGCSVFLFASTPSRRHALVFPVPLRCHVSPVP
jgi:hypothetical protein